MVDQGTDTPYLQSTMLWTEAAHWIAGAPPASRFSCTAQTRYRQHTTFKPQPAVGLGLRVTTPIGPIRLDYGYGNEGGRLHFSIGHSF